MNVTDKRRNMRKLFEGYHIHRGQNGRHGPLVFSRGDTVVQRYT